MANIKWKKTMAVLLSGVFLAINTITVFAYGSHGYIWPVPGNTHLYRGVGNGHSGLDIAVKKGNPVYAARDGVVKSIYVGCTNFDGYKNMATRNCKLLGKCNPSGKGSVDFSRQDGGSGYSNDGFCNGGNGNVVFLYHTDSNTATGYSHLTSIAPGLKNGDSVKQGQLIGYSGSTGRSSGEHLHFELRQGNNRYSFFNNDVLDPLKYVNGSDVIEQDKEAPVITNVSVSNVTAFGYTVSCNVTDNQRVSNVYFPTWTMNAGQDDLVWGNGTVNGNTYTFYVSISSHKNESGIYNTHIYAQDDAGNTSFGAAPSVHIPAIGFAEYGLGDINGDGSIDSMDSLTGLRYAVGLIDLDAQSRQRGDINKNGALDAEDALWIIKYAAKLVK